MPYTVTFKGGPADHAPTITIQASSETELELRLNQLESNSTLATIGRLSGQMEAQYNLGRGLGAFTTQAPRDADIPAAPEPPAPAAEPEPAPAAPQVEEPATPDPASGPVLAGLDKPARLVKSKDPNKSWMAWADPRPLDITRGIYIKTDDPNDPRLATGEVKFWAFV